MVKHSFMVSMNWDLFNKLNLVVETRKRSDLIEGLCANYIKEKLKEDDKLKLQKADIEEKEKKLVAEMRILQDQKEKIESLEKEKQLKLKEEKKKVEIIFDSEAVNNEG